MKVWFRRILNLLLYLSFCVMVGTGLLVQFKLVPGSEGGHGLSAFGMTRHEWGNIHYWVSVAFIAFVAFHLILSWGWLKRVAANKKIWPVVIGLILGLGIISFIFFQPIETSEGRGKGHSQRDH